nr:alpha/beta fold hydrolase [Lujinxingiaceae bacterium]
MLLTHPSTSHTVALRSVYRPSTDLGQPFHWLEAGWDNPETIVLLHGLMAHSMAFRCVVAALSADYRVIIPDLPGHGRDQSFRAQALTPQIDSMVDWLAQLLDSLGTEKIHLVGHSLGATLSFLAASNPERFAQLATISLVSPGLQLTVPRWAPNIVKRIPVSLARLGTCRMGIRLYEP